MFRNDDATKEKQQREDMFDLLLAISDYGSIDLKRCVEVLNSTDLDYYDFANELESFCEDCDLKINKMDLVGFSYDLILRRVVTEILEKTKTDIFELGNFEVHWNYYCSCYNFNNTELERLIPVFDLLNHNEISPMLRWFMDQVFDAMCIARY